jgi:divalent metal cation (Fe/Co/Zn/Cd) transporter
MDVSAVEPRWLNLAIGLVAFTVLYNLAEAGASVWLGLRADSIALEGFGLDSLIEVSAAALMLWRLLLQKAGSDDAVVEASEIKVHRFVGVTFLLLALYIGWQSGTALWHAQHPQESLLGIGLAILSLVVMPLLVWGKLKVAAQIQSSALVMEAKETIACSLLSFILLAGLALHAWLGWWWADPVAGLCMIPWLVKEGLAGLRGESCCG